MKTEKKQQLWNTSFFLFLILVFLFRERSHAYYWARKANLTSGKSPLQSPKQILSRVPSICLGADKSDPYLLSLSTPTKGHRSTEQSELGFSFLILLLH
jgi:hypothetical protein